MNYYAHTAAGPDGQPLPENSGRWPLLCASQRGILNGISHDSFVFSVEHPVK